MTPKRFSPALALGPLVMAVLLATCGCSQLKGITDRPEGGGVVTGRVTDQNGTSLVGAAVKAGGSEAATGEGGYYRLEGVQAGSQTVSASMNGYRDMGAGTTQVSVTKDREVGADGLKLVMVDGGWVLLRRLSAVQQQFGGGQGTLAGKDYFDCLLGGLTGGDSRQATYSLGKRCTLFQTTVGVSDLSATQPNSEVVFEVLGDGNKLWESKRTKLGDPDTSPEVDISGVLTLVIRAHGIEGTGGQVEAVWANPKVK